MKKNINKSWNIKTFITSTIHLAKRNDTIDILTNDYGSDFQRSNVNKLLLFRWLQYTMESWLGIFRCLFSVQSTFDLALFYIGYVYLFNHILNKMTWSDVCVGLPSINDNIVCLSIIVSIYVFCVTVIIRLWTWPFLNN